ncbi:MAG: hypothetical protein WC329_01770 [Candidatus Omnitrophota bacterium]|jgi:hypothetical protein
MFEAVYVTGRNKYRLLAIKKAHKLKNVDEAVALILERFDAAVPSEPKGIENVKSYANNGNGGT